MLAATNATSVGALPAAAVVAACALLFTIASFWWLNARQGLLKSYAPHSFAAAVTGSKTLIRIPLIFFNTGPKPIIVQNLRLVFPSVERDGVIVLPWSTTRDRIRPERDDDPRLPSVFVVAGRSAVQVFVEFSTPFPNFIPEHQEYQATIQCKLGHRKQWKGLLVFPIQLGNIASPAKYIAYSNEPDVIAEPDRNKATDALEILRSSVPNVSNSANGGPD
ncbi:hypothetical protein P3L51_19020 [Streptomyces sp. PSRA5]|uniref:hypothetical protein n=1 Tax=Streptomyces panacea TaxID=3035064 RepID=UPI00339C93AF